MMKRKNTDKSIENDQNALEVFDIFNSTLKTNLRISDRISNFELVNSEILRDGLGIRLSYKEIEAQQTKKWEAGDEYLMNVSIYLYDKKMKSIPDCVTDIVNIQSEILINEFNDSYKGIIDILKNEDTQIILKGSEPKTIDNDFPMITNSIVFDQNDQYKLTQLYLTSLKNNFLKFHTNVHLFSKSFPNDKEIFENIWLSMSQEGHRKKEKIINKFLNDFFSHI
jgi:hypothetical protein